MVDRRYAMPSSERDERVALTVEKGIPLDDERASSLIARVSKAASKSGVRLDRSTTKRRPSACADVVLLRMGFGARGYRG